MTLNIYNLNLLFENTKTPLLILYICICKTNNFTDEELSIIFRIFLKYHGILGIQYNLNYFIPLLKNKTTIGIIKNIIKKFYNNINKLYKIMPHIVKIGKTKIFNKNKNQTIDEQISFLKNMIQYILAIFDSNKCIITFIERLKMGYNDTNSYNVLNNEIIYRLKLLKKKVGREFYKTNNIYCITNEEYEYLEFENKIKYVEYMKTTTTNILLKYIHYLELYNVYSHEFDNLLNPEIITIDIDDHNILCDMSDFYE